MFFGFCLRSAGYLNVFWFLLTERRIFNLSLGNTTGDVLCGYVCGGKVVGHIRCFKFSRIDTIDAIQLMQSQYEVAPAL
jgi:hypothetical protein